LHFISKQVFTISQRVAILTRFTCQDYRQPSNAMEIEDDQHQASYMKYYIEKATQMKYNSKYTLEVDFHHIKEWSAQQPKYDLSKSLKRQRSGQQLHQIRAYLAQNRPNIYVPVIYLTGTRGRALLHGYQESGLCAKDP
jgi:hypothetical protein